MELVVKQPNAEYNEQTSDSADDGGAECVYNIAARSYGYKTCKRCIKTHGDIGLTVLYPCKDHACYRSDSRRDGGGEKDRAELFDGGCRSTVEAVPAEP